MHYIHLQSKNGQFKQIVKNVERN